MKSKILLCFLFISMLASATDVYVGNYTSPSDLYDGSNLQNSPITWVYKNSASQILYQSGDITGLQGQDITSISFKYFNESCYEYGYTSTMKLYITEVSDNAFTKDATNKYQWFGIDAPNATLNFTADFMDSYYDDAEITFDLTANPYQYHGGNLLITVVNESSTYIDGGLQFYYADITKSDYISAVYGSDTKTFATALSESNTISTSAGRIYEYPVTKFSCTASQSTDLHPLSSSQPTCTAVGMDIIICNLPENADIKLFDINGRLLFQQNENRNELSIPTREKGLYIVIIEANGVKQNYKTVIL